MEKLINFECFNKEQIKSINYYKELGYEEKYAIVLGLFTYNSTELMFAVKAFNEKKNKNVMFCDSVVEELKIFLEENKSLNTIDFFKSYIKKYSPKIFEKLFGQMNKMMFSSDGGFKSRSVSYSMSPRSFSNACVAMNCVSTEASIMPMAAMKSIQAPSNISSPVVINSPITIIEQRTDKYNQIEESGFLNTLTNPTSTFRTTCNTASMGIVKSNILRGERIDKSMVRIEELMNYFNYKLEKPTNKLFKINTEVYSRSKNKKLLFIGLQGQDIIPKKQNIVLLLDVSGSMSGREQQMQASIFTILANLNDGDKISLITYSSDDEVIFKNVTWNKNNIDKIIQQFFAIRIYGCTYGSKALASAYSLIKSNKIKDGINRVVILTDGDFNFGETGIDSVEKLILEKKKTGAYLSVIGTGTHNINDHLMETLAKNGNGNYVLVNNLDDVKESISNNYNSLMFTIATDVKAQVEFNPKYVKSYRLIGYENRQLKHEDFKNDKIISEPFSCGSYSIALYEIETNNDEIKSDLKYQEPKLIDSNEICTVKVRYKMLNEKESKEISKAVVENKEKMSENMKLAYLIYMVGEKLRESEFYNDKDTYVSNFINEKLEFVELLDRNKDKIEMLRKMFK